MGTGTSTESTVLADICASIPGYEIVSKILPLEHNHRFKEQMKEKTFRHIEPTIDLSEMETSSLA